MARNGGYRRGGSGPDRTMLREMRGVLERAERQSFGGGEQNPAGGGQPAFQDPQSGIRQARIISEQASHIAYLSGRVAALERQQLAGRRQRGPR